MKFGLYMPNYGDILGYAENLAKLAKEADEAGWNGFFIFDHILAQKPTVYPMVDPWIGLTAIAMNTTSIRFGTTITPIARRRPWKLARETASLDQLSKGRLILSVGLGTPADIEFGSFGEETNNLVRAEKLDEGLNILLGLWSGEKFSHDGKHFHINDVQFLPETFQKPRIPIWGGGFWPHKKPFIRSSRLDGIFPLSTRKYGKLQPEDYKKIKEFIFKHRNLETPFDMVHLGGIRYTSDYQMKKFEEAGVTWLLKYIGATTSMENIMKRIRRGVPDL